jgi:hypothetical protein
MTSPGSPPSPSSRSIPSDGSRGHVDGVNAATRRVQNVHPASRDFARDPTVSRRFQTVGTGSIPATSTLIMPLTCNDAVSRSRIPLPPPPLRCNGFRVFLGAWRTRAPFALGDPAERAGDQLVLTASTRCQQSGAGDRPSSGMGRTSVASTLLMEAPNPRVAGTLAAPPWAPGTHSCGLLRRSSPHAAFRSNDCHRSVQFCEMLADCFMSATLYSNALSIVAEGCTASRR